jgi:UDP-N-acetylmuramate dehydrogenase
MRAGFMVRSNRERIKHLIKGIESDNIIFDKNTAELTSIKAGGKVFCYFVADNIESLKNIVRVCSDNGIDYAVIGDGTNILFNNRYLDLLLIKLGSGFKYIDFSHRDRISVGAAYRLFRMVVSAADRGYDYSELSGIPGTVGGAVIGNSGTKDTGICDFIEKITYLSDKNGDIEEKNRMLGKSDFDYRNFYLQDVKVLTGVVFKNRTSKRNEVFNKIRNRVKKRKSFLPVNTKTAGCFFKNVKGMSETSGRLIENCGMKGFIYGGARVSQKHANFIENFNDASSEDIFVLSNIIKYEVIEKFKVELEYEVKTIGF